MVASSVTTVAARPRMATKRVFNIILTDSEGVNKIGQRSWFEKVRVSVGTTEGSLLIKIVHDLTLIGFAVTNSWHGY
jgi:hypothetical protein